MANDTILKEGMILSGTRGYSMIIPCFYKVTKVTPTGCKVVELDKYVTRSADGGYNQQCYEKPKTIGVRRGAKEQMARSWGDGEWKIGSSRNYTATYVRIWDGQEVYADYCD